MEAIDFDTDFDPAYGIIYINPSRYMYYRGYDSKYPSISNRPAYFGSLKVASAYANAPGRKIDAFTNSRILRVIDVRFMKDILRNLFEEHDHDVHILSTTLSFGLCSLYHQIRLAAIRLNSMKDEENMKSLKQYYKEGLYEQQGVRIAEITNDAETMGFLKTLFSDFIDGFISPRQFSPFHTEKPDNIMNGEMIIFNPLKSGIIITPSDPNVQKIGVTSIYIRNMGRAIHTGYPEHPYKFYAKAGGSRDEMQDANTTLDEELPSVEQINMRFEEPEIQAAWNRGVNGGALWKKHSRFQEIINPVPTAKVRSWAEVKECMERSMRRRTTRRGRTQW